MQLEALKAQCDSLVGLSSTIVDDHDGVGLGLEFRTPTGIPLFTILVTEFEDQTHWMVYDFLGAEMTGPAWDTLRHLGREPETAA